MARAIRLEHPGAFYHVLSRGNERKDIYRDAADYAAFLHRIAEASDAFGFLFHAYALMPNHYHLLVETPNGKLSQGMRHINGTYSQYFNKRHDRVGHVFQGRFKAILVEKESYLLTLSRYIHRNPSKAGLVEKPWDYPWSSCRQFLGLQSPASWMAIEPTLERFGSHATDKRREYAKFVSKSCDVDPIEESVGQLLLGTEAFITRMKAKARSIAAGDPELGPHRPLAEHPSPKVILDAVHVSTGQDPLTVPRPSIPRSMALYLLRSIGGLALKELTGIFSLSPSTISETVAAFEKRSRLDVELSALLSRTRERIAEGVPKTEDVTPD